MNNQIEIAFSSHIMRLEVDIAGRDNRNNPLHSELTRIDVRNIASLREGRIPEYGDHMMMDNSIEMYEFSDLTRFLNENAREEAD